MLSKVVLVTGASSGIGAACAAMLAKRGFRVYGSSRNPNFKPSGYQALQMDVTDDHSVDEAVAQVGDPDVVADIDVMPGTGEGKPPPLIGILTWPRTKVGRNGTVLDGEWTPPDRPSHHGRPAGLFVRAGLCCRQQSFS